MSDITNLSYWFDKTLTDPNGNVVTDINAGLVNLIPNIMPELNNLNNEHERFVLTDIVTYQPDLIAHVQYKNDDLFWYVCLANLIDNCFDGFDSEHIYYAFSTSYLSMLATNNNAKKNPSNSNGKIGTTITLN